MNNQTGSILLILMIIITLTSITSVVILQSGLSLKKQNSLSMLHQKSNEIANSESSDNVVNITSGTNLSLLPYAETTNHQFENHQFTTTHKTTSNPLVNSPLNGYSLHSVYKTQLIELKTSTSSSMIKSRDVISGFGCLLVEDTDLSNQIEPTYFLDIDKDSIDDISYQLDSASGDIFRVDSSTQLLINLTLDAEQSFSRPKFSIFDGSDNSTLVIAFIVHNTGTVAQTASNSFYLLFDKPLLNSTILPPINPNELIDLNANPIFSVTDKGYFLKLDQGQLITSAITIFNHKIIFTTQSSTTNPNTGLPQYTNKLVSINLDNDSAIIPTIQEIPESTDLLNLRLSTQNHLIIILSSQFAPLVNLPGECRTLYQYEN